MQIRVHHSGWLAGLQSILVAVQVWQNERSIKAAAGAYRQEKAINRTYEWFVAEITVLTTLIPENTLNILIARTKKCQTRYEDVLLADNEFLPAEIDEATLAVKQCVCRELARIAELNGGDLPTENMNKLWQAYNCSAIGKKLAQK